MELNALEKSMNSSINSIFSLCMKLNALEKSMNSCIALWFFSCTPLLIQCIARIYEVMYKFLRKLFWIFLRIFFTSGLIQLRSSKSYASVNLSDYKVAFFEDEEDAVFPFCFFGLYTALHNWRSISTSNFLVFHTSGGILLRPATF